MLKTEMRNPHSTHISAMPTEDMVALMQQENLNAVRAIDSDLHSIAKAIDAISERMQRGGRLFYIGCGTSGRLGVLDASECPPTFGVAPELVVGIIAGGEKSMFRASEGQEDDPNEGIEALKIHGITDQDVVVGLSAAGGAAFVCNAIAFANSLGCVTVGISCNPGSRLEQLSAIPITPDTGAEALTGSTRLKAGNAQKMILNMLSTGAMVRSGHVYENMMINLRPTNIKLRGRVVRIVREITDLPESDAIALLEKAGWVIKDALKLWKEAL
jgi:N-acetylmuramic acid 6-phosphate etherase